jgi:hypothetical protein
MTQQQHRSELDSEVLLFPLSSFVVFSSLSIDITSLDAGEFEQLLVEN